MTPEQYPYKTFPPGGCDSGWPPPKPRKPVSDLISHVEVVSDTKVMRVERIHLTDKGKKMLTADIKGPLPGLTPDKPPVKDRDLAAASVIWMEQNAHRPAREVLPLMAETLAGKETILTPELQEIADKWGLSGRSQVKGLLTGMTLSTETGYRSRADNDAIAHKNEGWKYELLPPNPPKKGVRVIPPVMVYVGFGIVIGVSFMSLLDAIGKIIAAQ